MAKSSDGPLFSEPCLHPIFFSLTSLLSSSPHNAYQLLLGTFPLVPNSRPSSRLLLPSPIASYYLRLRPCKLITPRPELTRPLSPLLFSYEAYRARSSRYVARRYMHDCIPRSP